MVEDVKHVDASEMAAFLKKPADEKLLEIWLNGRETNGSVADAKRDIAKLQELEPRVAAVEKWVIRVSAVAAVILAASPFVFKLIGG